MGARLQLRLPGRGRESSCRTSTSMAGKRQSNSSEEYGGESTFVPADVSDGEQVAQLVAATLDRYGRLDCAHNNGGIEGPLASVVDLAEDDWNRVIDINLKGMWWCLKHEIPAMLMAGGGAIVNTASVSGLKGFPPLLPAYVASKFGVVGLTAVTARYYAEQGIRVNAVCPGAINTPMLDRIGEGAQRLGVAMVAENPSGRLGTPRRSRQRSSGSVPTRHRSLLVRPLPSMVASWPEVGAGNAVELHGPLACSLTFARIATCITLCRSSLEGR